MISLPPFEKTLPIGEDGTVYITTEWYQRFGMKYSVYYQGDKNKPLFECFAYNFEDPETKIEKWKRVFAPWIAITELRYARLLKNWIKFKENKVRTGPYSWNEYISLETKDGRKFVFASEMFRIVLSHLNRLFQSLEQVTYDIFENDVLETLERISAAEPIYTVKNLRNQATWVVCALIGLGVLDIEYILL